MVPEGNDVLQSPDFHSHPCFVPDTKSFPYSPLEGKVHFWGC